MKKYFVLITIGIANSLFSQNLVNSKPYINCVGTAEAEVAPDQIFISIYLTDKNSSKIASSIQEQEQFLIKAVHSLKIDPKKLVLKESDAQYSNIGLWKKEVIATKQYSLEVQNSKQLALVYDELKKINIQTAFISEVKYSKKDSLLKALRIKAIQDALYKADYLTKAINHSVDMPLEIEDRGESNDNDPVLFRGFATLKDASADDFEHESDLKTPDLKSIRFSTSIFVKFGIK